MKDTLDLLTHRGSIRKFSDKEIPKEVLHNIYKATICSQNYANGQQYSIIVVTDQKKKDFLYEATVSKSSGRGMSFIKKAPIFLLFVMDFNKIDRVMKKEKVEMKIQDSLEALLIGAVDVGIAIEAATVAVANEGLGSVAVGAIRTSVKEIIEIFELPEYTYPIAGLAIGYLDEGVAIFETPRLPLKTFLHDNSYDKSVFDELVDKYDVKIKETYASKGIPDLTWSKFVSTYYSKPIYIEQIESYKKQGFKL